MINISLGDILDITLDVLNVDVVYFYENLKSRKSHFVKIKQIVSLIASERGFSLNKIGGFLDIDHSTVHHNIKQAKAYVEYEKQYAEQVNKIREVVDSKLSLEKEKSELLPCYTCEVFKNHERDRGSFIFGFFCPIKQAFVLRDDFACAWIVDDNLPF